MNGYDGSLPPDGGGFYYSGPDTATWILTTEDEPADDPHADCIQPHTRGDGEHYDCDGQPI